MLDIVFNNSTDDKVFDRSFFKKIILTAVKNSGIAFKKIELSINLVKTAEITRLNRKYRGKNKPTDILSFPLRSKKVDIDNYFGGIMPLGDIFICLPIAKKDAIKEGMVLSSKLAFLTVHGFLHLLGYEHEKLKKDRKKMFNLQSKILKNL